MAALVKPAKQSARKEAFVILGNQAKKGRNVQSLRGNLLRTGLRAIGHVSLWKAVFCDPFNEITFKKFMNLYIHMTVF